MRLPWPFGRSTPSDGPAASVAADHVPDPAAAPQAAATTALAGHAAPPARPTGAWAALPPIQRTVGDPPVVASSASFLADVPGHTPLPPIVQPLGHETGPAAPPGLVVAHVRPVPSLTSASPLPTRPVQHHAASPSGPAAWADVAAFEPEPAAATGVPPASAGGPAPDTALVRTLPAVPAAATVTPPARSLTRVAASPTPLRPPGAGRSAGGGPGVQRTTTGSPAAAAPGATSSLPLPHTVSRWAEAAPRAAAGASAPSADARASAADAGASSSPAPGPVPVSRDAARSGPLPAPAPSPSRRAGLGAPISVQPASAVQARPPVRPASPRPAAGDQPASGPEAPGGRPAPARAPTFGSGQAAPVPRALPVLPVSRRPRDDRATSDADQAAAQPADSGTPAATGTPPSRPIRPTSPAVVPLLGARPLRPTAQRQAAPVGSTLPPGEAGPALAPPVPARWTRDDLPNMVTTTGRPPAGTEPEPVPLAALGAAASPAPEPPRDAGEREIVFPPRDGSPEPGPAGHRGWPPAPTAQRQATSMPAPSPFDAGSGAVIARSGATAAWTGRSGSQAPATTATPAMTLARSAGAGQGPGGAGTPSAGSTATPAPAPVPTVQAIPDSGASGLPGLTAVPVVQRVDGAAPAAPAEEGQSDSELDELAQALFGRIRGRLRAEVIHEREARGLTFDAF